MLQAPSSQHLVGMRDERVAYWVLHLGHSYVTPPLLLCTSFSCRLHEAGSPNALGQYSHVYGLSPVLQTAYEHHLIEHN
jgi:hypothetical protein